jgi:hypothetical protein
MDLSESLTIRLDTFGTALCSLVSLIGSILVIVSYLFVKTIATRPRAARIILNLSIADCVWFSASFIQSCFWLFAGDYGQPGSVPVAVCSICSPLVSLGRISSLLWTCVIAFEAVQSVKSRTWHSEVQQLSFYDNAYLLFVYLFSIPGALLAIIKQHTGNHGLGCEPGYERLGEWYEIVFTELIPIVGGFVFNIYAFLQVRSKLSTRAFPRSVRKRRKRVMYHYIVVCLLCWCPTILFYLLELFGVHRPMLEVVSRVSLYTTGFFNFLVFGMQDPHLSRSFRKFFHLLGLGCLVGVSSETNLQRSAVEKTVMFENAQKTNADIAKDKKTVYRYHRLSRDERQHLYQTRPDLDLKSKTEPLLDAQEEAAAAAAAASQARERESEDFPSYSRESSLFDESEALPSSHFSSSVGRNIDGKMIRKEPLGGRDSPNSRMAPMTIGSDDLIVSPLQAMDGHGKPPILLVPPSPHDNLPLLFTDRRRVNPDLPREVQERIQSLSSGYVSPGPHLDSFPNLEEGGDEAEGLVSNRGKLVLESDPRELSVGDSIFTADHEEEESSSSEEDEDDPNDIVG